MTFLGILRSDLRRAFVSPRLVLVTLLVYTVYMASGYYEYLYALDLYYDVATLFDFLHYTGVYVTMIILCASFCYSDAFCTDWKDKALYLYCVRGSTKNYCAVRVLTCALAGGLGPVLGLLLFVVTFSFRFPLLDVRGGRYSSTVDEVAALTENHSIISPVILSENGALYFALIFYLVFLVCALYAVVGLAVSVIIPNRFVAIFSPYLLFFLESLFLSKIPVMKSIQIMSGNFSFGLGVFGNLLVITLVIGSMIALLGVFFTKMVKRKLANETN